LKSEASAQQLAMEEKETPYTEPFLCKVEANVRNDYFQGRRDDDIDGDYVKLLIDGLRQEAKPDDFIIQLLVQGRGCSTDYSSVEQTQLLVQ
jgi:hypothetical protein